MNDLTPGPWRWITGKDGELMALSSSNEVVILPALFSDVELTAVEPVMSCRPKDMALIAAAADLLAACEKMITALEDELVWSMAFLMNPSLKDAYHQLEAAVSKARGVE